MAVDIRAFAKANKTLAVKPDWRETDSTWFGLTAVLDIDGETIEGLELRGGACQTLPDRAVRFQLQYYPAKGECVRLGRVEWRPLSPHTNPANCPEDLKLLRITGSHSHGFDLNWLDQLDRLRTGNLPVAEPLTVDPPSFEDLLEVVGKEFRIRGLDRIERPPWRMADFFGV